MVDVQQLAAAAVDQHRAQLVALVDAEVERLVGELVAERLAAGGNGNGTTTPLHGHRPPADVPASPAAPESAPKVCRRCGREQPASAFEPQRRVCRSCRRAADRERDSRSRVSPTGDSPDPG